MGATEGTTDLASPRFRLLGPTELHGTRGPVELGAPQQRCVLVVLMLEAGRVVAVDRLIDAVWPGGPPASARKAIQVYVSQLRHALADVPGAELVTNRPGYRLEVDRHDVDVHWFRELVEQARSQDPERAGDSLGSALKLWRGPAVADIADEGLRELLAAGLEEERLAAVEARFRCGLRAGRAGATVPGLAEHVAAYPLRERGYRLLMCGLRDCGREAEAMAVYENARETLAAALGTEPGPELRALHAELFTARAGTEDVPGDGAATVGGSVNAGHTLITQGGDTHLTRDDLAQ